MKPWLRITIAIAIVVVLSPFVFVLKAYTNGSGAMQPTLESGDTLYVNRWATDPGRGDVVVFKYPKRPDQEFLKRVIAVGGDTVEVRADVVYVNGHPVARHASDGDCVYQERDEERWEERRCRGFDEELDGHRYRVVFDRAGAPHSAAAVTVPPGHFFVMGDNRDNSHDSRYWGFVPPGYVRGTAMFVCLSRGPDGIRWNRIGKKIQ
jgi:signal peptidase I